MRIFYGILNLLAIAGILTLGSLAYVWPERLPAVHLSPLDAQLIVMQLVSLILLLAFVQRQLSLPWRLFTLAGSFLILGESVLMSGVLSAW